jgi:hypothetical protein
MEFCFIQNENILNLIQSKEHCQVTNFKGKRKGKVEEKESFEKSAKKLFQFIRDQEQRKIGMAKADENKSDFPKPIIMVKIL